MTRRLSGQGVDNKKSVDTKGKLKRIVVDLPIPLSFTRGTID